MSRAERLKSAADLFSAGFDPPAARAVSGLGCRKPKPKAPVMKSAEAAIVRSFPTTEASLVALRRLNREARETVEGVTLIATRVYPDFDPTTRREHECIDYMYRLPSGEFVLRLTGGCPGEPELEQPFDLEGVYGWLSECPEQIERAMVGHRHTK